MLISEKVDKVKFWLNICNYIIGYTYDTNLLNCIYYMYSKLFPDASEEASICGHTFANAGQALAL